jgi:hypothetical protein
MSTPRALDEAGGCPVAVAYAIVSPTRGFNAREAPSAIRSFELLAQRIFAARSPRERQFLLSASLLPAMSPDLLEACGWLDWRAVCRAMHADAPFMWEIQANTAPRFHDRFADYLALQMLDEEASLRLELAQHAVFALEPAGEYGDALHAAVRQGLSSSAGARADRGRPVVRARALSPTPNIR